ncbi:MAG: PQQ-dependent sugar dehydrogenase [Acidobacteriota bacterium]
MPRLTALLLRAALPILLCATSLVAQGVDIEEVASISGVPVAITHAGDDRVFITEQSGRVLILRGGNVSATPFLDITDRVRSGGEQGLLSIAFHPRYASNGRVFANYTNFSGDTVIARFEVSGGNPDRANAASERELLVIPQPFTNHNGGQLQFGPDGYLYIGMGDGGSANDPDCLAQNTTSLLGKMLRLDIDTGANQAPFYTVPADNPFIGSNEAPDEAWATGLRNPWRFSFDRQTGELFIGDVGQNQIEEISYAPAGSNGGFNYGWKVMEGSRCFSTNACGSVPPCNSPLLTDPILEYDHSQGCSVTGGYVYRGNDVSELSGDYVYGDLCSRQVWAASRQGNRWSSREVLVAPRQITTFGEDRDGELYMAGQNGDIYRFTGTPSSGPTGTVSLVPTTTTAIESDGPVAFLVQRTGGTGGAASVDYETRDQTATAGSDYVAASGTLEWTDGDDSSREFEITLIDDDGFESDETFEILLSNAQGASLGDRAATVTLQDDDPSSFNCTTDPFTLCLEDGRFRVRAQWASRQGNSGAGRAVQLTPDTGFFWFFDPENLEAVVKVLDACAPFEAYWVFAAGLTDVEVVLEVTDSSTGQLQRYENPQGTPFQPVQDTAAFDCTP